MKSFSAAEITHSIVMSWILTSAFSSSIAGGMESAWISNLLAGCLLDEYETSYWLSRSIASQTMEKGALTDVQDYSILLLI